jgi:hypothetical protein
MGEGPTVYIRGESGVVRAHDLPLPWGVADRLAKGQLAEVDGPDDPTALTAPEDSPIVAAEQEQAEDEQAAEAEQEQAEDEKPVRPVVNASKAEWSTYAKRVDQDLTDEDLAAMTKADIIARY